MSKRIMAVDDSTTMRDMVRFALRGAGYEVVLAEDGMDALALLSKERVDLVITDINMPNLDGIGLVTKLRQDPAYRTTPILILTTESEATKRQQGKDAGATGWLVKPFDPRKLVSVVQKVCP